MPAEDYKPNSHKYNDEHRSEPTQKKVKVRERTTIGQRFKDVFLAESLGTTVDYILKERFLPRIGDLVIECLHYAIDTMFGGSRGSRYNRYDDRPSYNTSRTRYNSSSSRPEPTVKVRSVSRFSTERYEFETRDDAEEVLRKMNERCRRYDGVCSVGYFLDCVDVDSPSDFTVENWGWDWDALDKARIRQNRYGSYVLCIQEPNVRFN